MNNEEQKYDKLIARLRYAEPKPMDPEVIMRGITPAAKGKVRRPAGPGRIAKITVYAAAVFLIAVFINEQATVTDDQASDAYMGYLYSPDMIRTSDESGRGIDELVRERIRAAEERRIMRERILDKADRKTKKIEL